MIILTYQNLNPTYSLYSTIYSTDSKKQVQETGGFISKDNQLAALEVKGQLQIVLMKLQKGKMVISTAFKATMIFVDRMGNYQQISQKELYVKHNLLYV